MPLDAEKLMNFMKIIRIEELFTDRYRIGIRTPSQTLFISKASGKHEFHEHYHYNTGAPQPVAVSL